MNNISKPLIDHAFKFIVNLLFMLIIITAFWLAFSFAGFKASSSNVFLINNVQEYPIGGIQGENIVIQTFKADKAVQKIGIKMAAYDRKNPGDLTLRVFDYESGDTYSYQTIAASSIIDNNFTEFNLNQVLPARKKLYAFELSGQTPTPYQSVGVWSSYNNTYSDGKLYLSEFETEGDLLFYLSSPSRNPVYPTVFLVLAVTFIMFGAIYFYIRVLNFERKQDL